VDPSDLELASCHGPLDVLDHAASKSVDYTNELMLSASQAFLRLEQFCQATTMSVNSLFLESTLNPLIVL
jgi:hypothetical protein